MKTHLPGHTSEETAYLVESYPYGSLRCKIKFWLEFTPKKGFRFVSRTQNPKNGVWNAPKKSTYAPVGAMYLDENGHVQWDSISGWSNPDTLHNFVKNFPGAAAEQVRAAVEVGLQYYRKKAEDQVVFVINGVRQPWTDADRAEAANLAEKYASIRSLL